MTSSAGNDQIRLKAFFRRAIVSLLVNTRGMIGGFFGLPIHPAFLIIGAQRSGTTSLYKYLASHPQVRMPFVKEIHYFDLNFGRGQKWYHSNFPLRLGRDDVITGEASPYYIFHPQAPARVWGYDHNLKLILELDIVGVQQ